MFNSKKSVLSYLLVAIFGFVIGLGIWYFRHTNFVASIVVDNLPLLEESGYTNVAIFGVGGEGHSGGELTDSIVVLSLRHIDHAVKMLSVPRDIWVDSLKIKINAAYYYGEERGEGQGLSLAKEALSQTLRIPIHYGALVDFGGFVKLIDAVGGIDVDVQRSFDDYKYPIPGMENAEPESSRYEHLTFTKGLTHMDGVTALKFARSRHAEGEEGTDFARGDRQKLIIVSLKDKLLSSKTLLNLNTLGAIADSINSSLITDIEKSYYRSFFDFFLEFSAQGSKLENGDLTPYLTNPKNLSPYQGAWVLLKSQGFDEYVSTFLYE